MSERYLCPAAELIEDISFDGTPGAVFEPPANRISFRGPKRQREATPAQIANLAKARESRQAA